MSDKEKLAYFLRLLDDNFTLKTYAGIELTYEELHYLTEKLAKEIEYRERVQELESFKNSVEYTVDTKTIELIVENQDSDVALSSVETYDEEIYFLKKRVEDNDQAIVDLNKHVEELEDENVDLEQQNKRYREAIIETLHGLKTLPSVAPRLYLISILDKALEGEE